MPWSFKATIAMFVIAGLGTSLIALLALKADGNRLDILPGAFLRQALDYWEVFSFPLSAP